MSQTFSIYDASPIDIKSPSKIIVSLTSTSNASLLSLPWILIDKE